LRYRDRKGQWCKARASTQQILQRLREGKLTGEAQACHEPQGDFQPLEALTDFRAAVRVARKKARKPRPAAPRHDGSKDSPGGGGAQAALDEPNRWWLMLGLGLGLAAAGGVVLFRVLVAA
jgi:hypothetical protein